MIKFIKTLNWPICCLLLGFLLFQSAVAQLPLYISAPVLMYNYTARPCDGVSATLRIDANTLRTFTPSWDRILIYTGTMSDPRATYTTNMAYNYFAPFNNYNWLHTCDYVYRSRQTQIVLFGDPDPRRVPNITLYLKNVCKIGPTELLGFIHVEYILQDGTNPYPAYYSIALCHSTNNGGSWTFCGDIIRTFNTNIDPDHLCNIGGAGYVVYGGYYYVFFNEFNVPYAKYPSVARAEVATVNTAARNNQVTDWRKYSGNGNWNALALSNTRGGTPGRGAGLIWPTGFTPDDMHTDAAYCNALREYLLTVYTPAGLYLLRSSDCITWRDPKLIAAPFGPANSHPSLPYFASLTGDANEDCSVVGNNFYVYFTNLLQPPTGGSWRADGTDLPLYRVQVHLPGIRPIISLINR